MSKKYPFIAACFRCGEHPAHKLSGMCHQVYCVECHSQPGSNEIALDVGEGNTEQEAIASWNRQQIDRINSYGEEFAP